MTWQLSDKEIKMKSSRLLLVFIILLIGTKLCADYYFETCYNFNENYASVWDSEDMHFQNDITVEVWINVSEWHYAWQTMIAKGDSAWRLHRNNETSQIAFTIGSGTTYYVSSTGINFINQWHHVAAVKSGTSLLLYVDGELNASSTCSATMPTNAYPINIGRNNQAPSRYFRGKMDELKVWNYARSANQIKNGRNNMLTGYESGLSIYYRMNVQSTQWYSPGPLGALPWATTYPSTYGTYGTYGDSDILVESYSGDRMYQYNGASESVVHSPLFSSAPSQFTAELWYKAWEINTAEQTVLYHGDNGEFQISTQNNVLTAKIKKNSSQWWSLSYDKFKEQQWYLISFSVDVTGLAALYLNGVLVDSGNPDNLTTLYDPGTSYVASIGSYRGNSGYIRGVIDEVRIWDSARSASQIWTNRHVELIGLETGLLAYYQFNESSGSVIFNQAGNTNNQARYINCITSQANSRITSSWPKNAYYLGGTISEALVLPSGLIEVWDDVIIPSESKLTIGAGSVIRFMDHYGIVAEGSLQAIGTPADSIRFTVVDNTGFDIPLGGVINTTGSWNGLAIRTSATSDSTLLMNCIIEYGKTGGVNLAYSDGCSGGGIHVSDTSRFRIENSRISKNIAISAGGAIYVHGLVASGGIIRNCNIYGNKVIGTDATGGAIYASQTPVLIENCRITDNQSNVDGGGIALYGTVNPGYSFHHMVYNNQITYNTALGQGGGIVFIEGTPSYVRGNLISHNTANIGGGIAWFSDTVNKGTEAQITSNIISFNTANKGGGLAFTNVHTLQYGEYGGANDPIGIRNNTIVYNEASICGGAFYFQYASSTGVQSTRIRNSILWGNTAPSGSQVYTNDNRTIIHFIYNTIEGGLSGFAGANTNPMTRIYLYNLETNPMFVGTGVHPYQVQPFSPCVNRGQPGSTANAYDFANHPRIYQPLGTVTPAIDAILSTIDIGAYEDQSNIGLVPYDLSISGSVNVGHRLTVPSTYKLTIAANSDLAFEPNMGIDVYGSLECVGESPQNRNRMRALNETLGWRGLVFADASNPADTSYIFQTHIRGGKATSRTKGGLILADGYSPLNISNCVLSDGEAEEGGAIAIVNADPQIYNSSLFNNTAQSGGGAIYCQEAEPLLMQLTVTNNTSTSGAGAIQTSSANSTKVVACNIWNNGIFPMSESMNVKYSNIEGGYTGATNIDLDPQVDPADPDCSSLQPSSPSLNKGISDFNYYPNLPSTDLYGNPRLHQHTLSIHDRSDIGAYEYPGLMAPANFNATDGNNDYPGRVYLSWDYNPNYSPSNGFQIFRDGTLLSSVYPQIFSYSDFEATPGQKHVYTIQAYAGAELSISLSDRGYVTPNGIITGTVTTPNNNPVADVVVSLSPSSGTSLLFTSDNSFSVEVPQADLGSAFTLETWVKTASADFALLSKTDISETDLKQLRIDASGRLQYSDGVNILSQEPASPVVNNNQWHHVALVYDASATSGKFYLDGVCVKDSLITLNDTPSGTIFTDTSGSFVGYLDDTRLWNAVRDSTAILAGRNVIVPWNSAGLIGYWAMNEASGNEVYDATNNANIAITDASWSSNEPGILLGGITNNWGEYVISQIPYGNYTTFTVTPSKAGHFFQPEQRLITLSQSNISANNVDFTDDSMIPISGRVMFQNTLVPVREANILLNGVSSVPPTLTDDNGYYVMDVEHGTVCTLSVSYNNQTFNRVWNLGSITFPQANKHFYNTTRTEFVVEVLGGADRYPIGTFNVTLNSVDNLYENIFEGVPAEWSAGTVVIDNIPPLNYFVTVNPSTGDGCDPFTLVLDPLFQDSKTQELDLRYPDFDPTTVDTLSYIWNNELQISVDWPEDYELKYWADDLEEESGFYVVDQNEWIQLNIRVYEDYSTLDFPGRKTYLTDCDITINDEVGPLGESETSLNGQSFITYRFAPYLPNILEGGERPYQNLLEIVAHDNILERHPVHTNWAIIQGARPQESTYATTSPELPFLILHDPPGDKSYSAFKTSSSHSTCVSFSAEHADEANENIVFHCGADFVYNTGIIFSTQTEINTILDFSLEMSVENQSTNSHETQFTFTTSEEYRTSEDDQLIGRESDLFIGGALNLIWGLTKELSWDDEEQAVELTNSVMVTPEGFDTHYIYTAKQIQLSVIPNLIAINDTTSANLWQSFLDLNEDNINNAIANPNHPANVSFNAGAEYNYEEENTSVQSVTYEFDTIFSVEMGAQLGALVNGLGVEGGWKARTAVTIGGSTQTQTETSTNISYVLADDDETSSLNYQSDYFTVDINKDPVYGTPVFNLLAGASSNRWEQNTLPRDGVTLTANTYAVTGLLEDQEAVFLLNLGNTSQTDEDRRYYLTLHHECNPGGAVVKINGLPLVERMPFDIPPGTQVQVVMTVEQGPYEFEYEDLTLELYAPGDRGNDGPEGHDFYVYKSFDVYWEPPYSKVAITYPFMDWTMNAADNDTLQVILSGYDLSKPDFEYLLFQYKHPYDQTWFTAEEISRADLVGTNYVVVPWDVSQLSDGVYDIRAGAKDFVQTEIYFCEPLRGNIDRNCPELLNPPQPSDGILTYGDQISVSFSEFIDPNYVIAPDAITLEIIRTSTSVDISINRFENTVYLVPNISSYWIENEMMHAKVSGLKDLNGNPLNEIIEWEFFVNANPVHWVQSKIEMIKPLGESISISTQLVNSGGQYSSFAITNLPQWLTVSSPQGELLPLDSRTLLFTVSDQLGYGVHRCTINADVTSLGVEPLVFEISVLANPPAWATSQLDIYEYSMTVTGQLSFDGALSEDTNDLIGAFVMVGNSYICRGVAPVKLVPFGLHPYQFFLTVFSDVEEGEPLIFRVWDSSENKEHHNIEEEFSFVSGAVHGTPFAPIECHVLPELFSSIDCRGGWNWISLNLANPSSMDINTLLSSLDPAPNDIVKNQTSFAQYTPELGWVGSLQEVQTTESLNLKLTQADLLQITGLLEDPVNTPITYGSGWNWLGYLPHISISVNEALADLADPVTGDLIKNQQGYAQYIDGYGWWGSLLFMDPGEGYMLKTADSGTFCYPEYAIPREQQEEPQSLAMHNKMREITGWDLNPLDYEYSSNITAIINSGNGILDSPDILLAAFYGDQCRGLAQAVQVLGQWVLFLTQYSNTLEQELQYKVYLPELGIFETVEVLPFINNQILGNPLDPFTFNLRESILEAPENLVLEIIGSALQLSWSEVNNATGYKVYASDDPRGDFVEISNLGSFDSMRNRVSPAAEAFSELSGKPGETRDPLLCWTCDLQDLPDVSYHFFRISAIKEARTPIVNKP